MKYPVDNYLDKKRGYTFGVSTSYSSFHLGEDLIGVRDEPIYAIDDGDIVLVENLPQGGLTIHLKLKTGELVRYLHLNKMEFNKPAKSITVGQKIGTMGSSGSLSSGVHLHWDVSKNGKLELNNLSNFINPLTFITQISMNYENKIIRNAVNGEYSFVLKGVRRAITEERAGLAAITAIDRGLGKDDIITISESEFNKIPKGKDF